MTTEQIIIVVLAVAAALLLILTVLFASLYFRGKRFSSANVIDGVRYSKKDAEGITHREGDFVLLQGKTYTAVKNGSPMPGNYTVLAASEAAKTFKLRIGRYVREYSHGDTVVLAEGETICAVSCNVILR